MTSHLTAQFSCYSLLATRSSRSVQPALKAIGKKEAQTSSMQTIFGSGLGRCGTYGIWEIRDVWGMGDTGHMWYGRYGTYGVWEILGKEGGI